MLEDGVVPDVIIADLDMPEISGEAMVSRLHAAHRGVLRAATAVAARPNLKVLYVTGNIDRLLNARSLIWEGEAFLDKPFTVKRLLEAVALLMTGGINAAPQPPRAAKSL